MLLLDIEATPSKCIETKIAQGRTLKERSKPHQIVFTPKLRNTQCTAEERSKPYEVDIRSSRSSASSQIANDATAIPASLMTFSFDSVGIEAKLGSLLRKFILLSRSSKTSKGKTASRRYCRLWTTQKIKLVCRRQHLGVGGKYMLTERCQTDSQMKRS